MPQDSFFSHSCPLFRQWLSRKADSDLETILCEVLIKRTLGKPGRCDGRRDIAKILLKTALNNIQPINQSINENGLVLFISTLKEFQLYCSTSYDIYMDISSL